MPFRSNKENQITRQDRDPESYDPFGPPGGNKATAIHDDGRSKAAPADGYQTLDQAKPGRERRGLSGPREYPDDYY
ncbi:MAG: hypothetical protein GY952_14160 [Rhodobacteraceae bacterium]|nr:hypothetical protein [Paracoccaceae bacterium]